MNTACKKEEIKPRKSVQKGRNKERKKERKNRRKEKIKEENRIFQLTS